MEIKTLDMKAKVYPMMTVIDNTVHFTQKENEAEKKEPKVSNFRFPMHGDANMTGFEAKIIPTGKGRNRT